MQTQIDFYDYTGVYVYTKITSYNIYNNIERIIFKNKEYRISPTSKIDIDQGLILIKAFCIEWTQPSWEEKKERRA